MSLYLISNMYPSEQGLRYGVFVKRFEEAVQKHYNVKRIVLTKKKSLPSKLLGYCKLFLGIIRLYFVVNRKDIVYVHFPTYVAFLLYPFLWRKIPLVINFHGSDAVPDSFLKKILISILEPIVKKCQQIVVPSTAYRHKISQMFNVLESKVFVYPSGGIDRHIFYPMKKETNIFTIGFISNFVPLKGWSVFLEALSIIKNGNLLLEYEVIMMGDGPDIKKIKDEISQRGLSVKLMKGVDQSELIKVYNALDIFVFPTYRESLGLVGLEAMMCAVPVLASAVQGPLEYVVDGYNGFLFEKGNSEQLASKLLEFNSLLPSQITTMKQNCIETSMKYEKDNVSIELLRVLEGIEI